MDQICDREFFFSPFSLSSFDGVAAASHSQFLTLKALRMAEISPHIASETKGPRTLGIFWAFYAVSVLMVSARLYIRAKWLKNTGLDDYIIAASMVMLTGYTVLSTVNVGLGYGKHTAVILQEGGMEWLVKILIVNYADFVLGIMSFTTPKLAIAALLNRVMNLSHLVFVSSTICIVVLFTMCDPPRALWQIDLLSSGQATCRPQEILVGYAIFTGAISGFVDRYLAVYPTIVLARLQITLKKKLALCAALRMGAVACAMAIFKCFQLPSLYNTSHLTCTFSILPEYYLPSTIESNIIIMASCIPTLGPLYQMARGKRSWNLHQRKHTFSGQRDKDLITTNISTTKTGSQESILRVDVQGKGPGLGVEQLPKGGIQRTDQVVVEYEMRPLD
ncbi:hypothetical protein BJX65DRAFT_321756 [Aspergillus insuetus]